MTPLNIITTSFLVTAVTICGVARADDYSQSPFGYSPQQAEDTVVVAEANVDGGKSEKNGPKSEVCLQFASDPDANFRALLKAGCEPTLVQVSKLMDNPLGSLAAMVNQVDLYRIKNDKTGVGKNLSVYTGIFQFPTSLNKNWNLVNRIIITAVSSPVSQKKLDNLGSGNFSPGTPGGGPTGSLDDAIGGRTTGLGDSYYVGLFAPTTGIDLDGYDGKLIWGAGFDLSFPTAEEDVLGSKKWSAGPSAVAAYLGPDWKLGTLIMHYSSFAGDNRDTNGLPVADVNVTNIQYFSYYNLSPTDAIGASPNIIVDWEADSKEQYTVPIGIGYAKTVKVGQLPVRFGLEFHYSVIRPDTVGTEWGVRFYMVPAVPSAMFDWMAG